MKIPEGEKKSPMAPPLKMLTFWQIPYQTIYPGRGMGKKLKTKMKHQMLYCNMHFSSMSSWGPLISRYECTETVVTIDFHPVSVVWMCTNYERPKARRVYFLIFDSLNRTRHINNELTLANLMNEWFKLLNEWMINFLILLFLCKLLVTLTTFLVVWGFGCCCCFAVWFLFSMMLDGFALELFSSYLPRETFIFIPHIMMGHDFLGFVQLPLKVWEPYPNW